jgi:hypothetical protein
MAAIAYWIQRANFATTEHGPVDATEAVRVFESHDWHRELNDYIELERAGAECCPPGIGFVAPNGEILHICPDAHQNAVVHYHLNAPSTILGIIPVQVPRVETREGIHRARVTEMIDYFFEGRRDAILQALGSPDSPSR